MDKVILVMNKPENCHVCPVMCYITGESDGNTNCPLHSIPEEKGNLEEEKGHISQVEIGRRIGWNDFRKELLG